MGDRRGPAGRGGMERGPARRPGRWIAGPRGPTPRRALRSRLPGRTPRAQWGEPDGAGPGRRGGAMGLGGGRGRSAARATFQLAAVVLLQPPEC